MTVIRPDTFRTSPARRGYQIVGAVGVALVVFMVAGSLALEYRVRHVLDTPRTTISEKLAHFLWELEQPQNWR